MAQQYSNKIFKDFNFIQIIKSYYYYFFYISTRRFNFVLNAYEYIHMNERVHFYAQDTFIPDNSLYADFIIKHTSVT